MSDESTEANIDRYQARIAGLKAKPEGPAPEPDIFTFDPHRKILGSARIPVPATAAPSQPAAREPWMEAAMEEIALLYLRSVVTKEQVDGVAVIARHYAAQAAAKDAEIERLTAIAGDLTDRNDVLTDESCKLQDDVAAIVSSHRSDWSWNDVIEDVKRLAALSPSPAKEQAVCDAQPKQD